MYSLLVPDTGIAWKIIGGSDAEVGEFPWMVRVNSGYFLLAKLKMYFLLFKMENHRLQSVILQTIQAMIVVVQLSLTIIS